MATVAYKRRLFPVQFLKARPMARSRVTTFTTEFVKIAETERNSEISQIFSDIFLGFFTPTFFSENQFPSGYYSQLPVDGTFDKIINWAIRRNSVPAL